MFLSKKKNGIYYIFYDQPNGKRTSKSTGTKYKSDALKFLNTFDSVTTEKIASEITLKDFCREFLKNSESHHTWKTTLTYKTTFNSFIKFLGPIRLKTITTLDVDKYIQNRIKDVSIHAARKDLINIKAAFNWAVEMNLNESNPANPIKRIKIPEKQPLFFSREEYKLLINVIDNQQIRAITEIAVNTGMRQMEILSLRWSQINLEERYITLNNQNHITKGKKIRTIPLNDNCAIVFNQLMTNNESDFVFHNNGKQIKQDFLVKNFKKYVRIADINPQLNFHSLRHTFASWLVQRGVSIYQVSKLLGHADIKTTEIYSHLRAEDLRDSINMLNN